jgi:hypothetical protein
MYRRDRHGASNLARVKTCRVFASRPTTSHRLLTINQMLETLASPSGILPLVKKFGLRCFVVANGILFVGWIVDTEGQNLNRYPSTSMISQAAQQRSIQPPSSRHRTFRSDDLVFEASTSAASQGHQYQRPAFPEAESNSMGG